ncbi:MAG: hypothetical protein ACKO0M_15545 [Cyanobium sp.]
MPSADTRPHRRAPVDGARPDPWPDRLIRLRCSPQVRLALRNLYILPSRFGWLWLLGCAALYWMGVGGGSSGALLLAYGGLGLFLLAPFLTQFNLQGLELACGEPAGGFAGRPLLYPLQVSSRTDRLQLRAWLRQGTEDWSGTLAAGQSRIAVPWTPERRGLQRPGRLRLESRAPLGLFVCWTLWEPATPQLVYPARRSGPVEHRSLEAGDGGTSARDREATLGAEEWRELAPHRPEEGLGRVAWKRLARSGIRLSKRFSDPRPHQALLSPAQGVPLETALEHLCDHCCRLAAAGEPFGLALGATVVPASTGERHLQRCLEVLARAEAP